MQISARVLVRFIRLKDLGHFLFLGTEVTRLHSGSHQA